MKEYTLQQNGFRAGESLPANAPSRRRFFCLSIACVLLHAFFMFFRYGQLPAAPLVPDEVIINDAAASLAHGHGYVSESLAQSRYGLDHVYAHFPPVYPYIQSVAFRVMGISVYSLRMTTTVMSILSAALLILVVWRFCSANWMSWNTGLLISAVFCTNASLIAIERMARMESTISVFVLLSMLAIAFALTQPEGRPVWPWTLAATLFAATTVAVHPEAITAIVILGAFLLFVVPGKTWERVGTIALLVLVPFCLAIVVYRAQIFVAVQQFLAIAHDSQTVVPTSYQWMRYAIHDHDISAVNRNAFLLGMMLLLALAPIGAWLNRSRQDRTPLQRRFALWFSVACTVDFVLMLTVLRMDGRRCQFIFGLLLIGDTICLSGLRPFPRWERFLGWLLVTVQIAGVCFYLSARANRVPEMNPDRYMSVIRRIPPGVSIGATPGLWLDFEEIHRPFSLILFGLDGEQAWLKHDENPLHQFDVVLLENYYDAGREWLQDEASQGRTEQDFRIGSHVVAVYTKPGVRLLPTDPRPPSK